MYNSLAAVCEDMQSNGISVVECELKSNPSLCMEKGRIVGYDRRKFENEAECCTALIHELKGEILKGFSVWEIAEHFNVTAQCIWDAYLYYRDVCGVCMQEDT